MKGRVFIMLPLLAFGAAACGGSAAVGGKVNVLITAYIPKDSGPYTVHVEALDKSTGQPLHVDDKHVAGGEYGPASLQYDSGHKVSMIVTLTGLGDGKHVPMSSYLRLQDGGLGKPKKSCTPANAQVTELRCSIDTKF